jgi:hypothetical protein
LIERIEGTNYSKPEKNNKTGRHAASPMCARIHLVLGEFETPFRMATKGVEERSYWMVFFKEDPVHDPIPYASWFGKLLKLME